MSKQRRVRETFQLLPEIDAAILRLLPPEGRMLGMHVIAKQVKAIGAELSVPEYRVTGAAVSGRMKVLEHLGFVVHRTVQPVAAGMGWQRTPKGDAWLASLDKGAVNVDD